MGRNYWCDFCQRGFSDILSTRKKHVKSIQHQRLRKLHYDSFKDPLTLLQDESQKTPCKRFFETGTCDFGDHCKFSHRDLDKLKKKAESATKKHEIDIEVVNCWIECWKEKKQRGSGKSVYKLPSGFPPPNQLPPSLQPHVEENEVHEEEEWG